MSNRNGRVVRVSIGRQKRAIGFTRVEERNEEEQTYRMLSELVALQMLDPNRVKELGLQQLEAELERARTENAPAMRGRRGLAQRSNCRIMAGYRQPSAYRSQRPESDKNRAQKSQDGGLRRPGSFGCAVVNHDEMGESSEDGESGHLFDPSRCRHMKQEFTEPIRSKLRARMLEIIGWHWALLLARPDA